MTHPHSIPSVGFTGAWHTLTLRGENRLIMPLLVTGCKIWHLRAAGRFYPKMAWLSTMRALPDASQVRTIPCSACQPWYPRHGSPSPGSHVPYATTNEVCQVSLRYIQVAVYPP